MAVILGKGGESLIFGKTTAHVAVIEFQKRDEIEMSTKRYLQTKYDSSLSTFYF